MQSMSLASLPVSVYFANQLAFSCEGGRVPSATASSIGFHSVCYRIRKGTGRHAPPLRRQRIPVSDQIERVGRTFPVG